jgi:hypothetical protein
MTTAAMDRVDMVDTVGAEESIGLEAAAKVSAAYATLFAGSGTMYSAMCNLP